VGFFGDLWKSMTGGGQAAANPGPAIPSAPQAAAPQPQPRSAVDRRTMMFSGPFVPGQAPPTVQPDPYAVQMPGVINRGPLVEPIPGHPDPDQMGPGLPWGNQPMSDAAILAWYQNMHARHVGNARTVPQMPSAPPVRNYDPNAATGDFLAAQQGAQHVDPNASTAQFLAAQNGALSATMPAMPR
jgi:hypothetical protein